jgi:hypothetical protein
MQAKYLSLLPQSIRTIVSEVETKCGCELLVNRNPDIHASAQFALSAPLVGQVEFNIEIKEETVEPDILAHETLHAHRYLVEGVPLLRFTRPIIEWPGESIANQFFFSDWAVDNAIEHLIIVPRLARLGIPQRDSGGTMLERHFRDYDNWTWPKAARRIVCIIGYLSMMPWGRPSFESAARRALQGEGLQKVAAELGQRLRRAARCKEDMIGQVCRAAEIPSEIVHLAYINMRDKTVRQFSYPPRMVVDEAAGTVACEYKTLGTFVRPLARGSN